MLAYARELLRASQRHRGQPDRFVPARQQLIRMLSHVAPSFADAQDDAHAHEDARAHDDAPPPATARRHRGARHGAGAACEPPVVERRVEHVGAVAGVPPRIWNTSAPWRAPRPIWNAEPATCQPRSG